MGRKACCPKEGLNRGAWTSHEDKLLSEYIMAHGLGRWRSLPADAGLNRCGKSCRLRWLNYLRPDIKRGNITQEEEDLIIRLHKLLGNRWSLIAGRLPGRTDNEIKNYWNTYLRKKVFGGDGESSPKAKKRSSAKHNTESSDDSSVNIVRTKAVRCTRSHFADLAPNQILDQDVGGFCTVDNNMQNLLFPQTPTESSYVSYDSFENNYGVIDIDPLTIKDISGCMRQEEDEELFSLIDNDVWDLLELPNKKYRLERD
uniref:Transcription factor MYB1 n=1 Tax=Ananas comosus var. bracteatus TaxID=296719 RepID=A0A6V7NQB6_ANACO|nr:unnamed protein product [Ananas comosus var. bracteatus]